MKLMNKDVEVGMKVYMCEDGYPKELLEIIEIIEKDNTVWVEGAGTYNLDGSACHVPRVHLEWPEE